MKRWGAQVARLIRLAGFSVYFGYELLVASLEVTWDVLTPRSRLSPGIIALPMRSRTDTEMTLMANLISLTPGTLNLTVDAERQLLYVHGMYAGSADDFRAELWRFERRMLAAVRLPGRPGEASADTARPEEMP